MGHDNARIGGGRIVATSTTVFGAAHARRAALQPDPHRLDNSIPASPANPAASSPKFFSLSDRVGRLRYLVYILGALSACFFLLVFVYSVAYLLPPGLGKLLSTTSYIMVKSVIFPLIVFVMSIRRLHDFNLSGWWSLLVLIPLVPFALLVIPGKNEANRFGPAPAPNPTSLKVAAGVFPCLLFGLYFSSGGNDIRSRLQEVPAAGGKPGLRSYDAR